MFASCATAADVAFAASGAARGAGRIAERRTRSTACSGGSPMPRTRIDSALRCYARAHAVWMSDRELAAGASDAAHWRLGGVPIIDEAVLARPRRSTTKRRKPASRRTSSGSTPAALSTFPSPRRRSAAGAGAGNAGHVASDSYFMLLARRRAARPTGTARECAWRTDRRAGAERSARVARGTGGVGC